MNRFSFTIQARPNELQKAVAGLERKRRDWKEEPLTFQGFINELPKISKDPKTKKYTQTLFLKVFLENYPTNTIL